MHGMNRLINGIGRLKNGINRLTNDINHLRVNHMCCGNPFREPFSEYCQAFVGLCLEPFPETLSGNFLRGLLPFKYNVDHFGKGGG